MRTTLRIDDRILRELKRMAATSGRTLTAVIEDALRQAVDRSKQNRSASRDRIRLPTSAGDGLRPGVDLDDSAALLEIMERER